MAITLQITDDTTTVNLVSPTAINALRQNWSPQVARPQLNQRAGVCPYTDVLETIGLSITGSSADDLTSNLNALIKLMHQVIEWRNGGNVAAVKIKYKPFNVSNTYQAVITDLPEGWLDLPSEYEFGVNSAVILQPVFISFWRRGLWWYATRTATGTGTTEPAVQTRTWTSHVTQETYSPFDIRISGGTGVDASGTPVNSTGYLLWQSGGKVIDVTDANSYSGTGFASEAITGSWGGSVMRATPTTTAVKTLTHLTVVSSGTSRPGRIGVFMRAKNNSSTVTWRVSYDWEYKNPDRLVSSRAITIGTADGQPKVYNLGTVYAEEIGGAESLRINATPSATGTASDALDVDAIGIIEISETSGAVYLERINYRQATHTLKFDPGFVNRMQASVYNDDATYKQHMPFRGDLWLNNKGGANFSYAILATTDGQWRLKEGNIDATPTDFAYDATSTAWICTLVPGGN